MTMYACRPLVAQMRSSAGVRPTHFTRTGAFGLRSASRLIWSTVWSRQRSRRQRVVRPTDVSTAHPVHDRNRNAGMLVLSSPKKVAAETPASKSSRRASQQSAPTRADPTDGQSHRARWLWSYRRATQDQSHCTVKPQAKRQGITIQFPIIVVRGTVTQQDRDTATHADDAEHHSRADRFRRTSPRPMIPASRTTGPIAHCPGRSLEIRGSSTTRLPRCRSPERIRA